MCIFIAVDAFDCTNLDCGYGGPNWGEWQYMRGCSCDKIIGYQFNIVDLHDPETIPRYRKGMDLICNECALEIGIDMRWKANLGRGPPPNGWITNDWFGDNDRVMRGWMNEEELANFIGVPKGHRHTADAFARMHRGMYAMIHFKDMVFSYWSFGTRGARRPTTDLPGTWVFFDPRQRETNVSLYETRFQNKWGDIVDPKDYFFPGHEHLAGNYELKDHNKRDEDVIARWEEQQWQQQQQRQMEDFALGGQ